MAAIILERTVTPCDLRTVKDTFPCLNCLSDSQLWMIAFITLNFIYNYLNNDEDTPVQRLQEMGCQNCLTDKQLMQAIVAKLIDTAADLGYEGSAGLEDASCTQCADPHAIKVAVASLLCGVIGVQITPQIL